MANPRYSVIIPTRHRYDDLCACLRSLAVQTLLPAEVIIIDASTQLRGDESRVYQCCASPILVRYIQVARTGSAWQRNLAIAEAAPTSEFLCFLDDDVILEPGCCEALQRPLEQDARVAATMGNLTNHQGYPYTWSIQAFYRLFLMEGRQGSVLPSGSIGHIRENQSGPPFPTAWLHGCVMFVRRAAQGELRFDPTFERFGGYAFNEDLDFSYALGRRGPLLCVPAARLEHKMSPAGRPTHDYRFGIAQVANRGLFVRKHMPGPLYFACYLWSMLGTLLINVAMIARGRSHTRALGNLIGLALVLSGQVRPADGMDG